MGSSSTTIALRVEDNIAFLTLNGPPKNELNSHFFESLSHIEKEKLKHLRIDGLIVEGAGRHFSSGANLPEIEAMCVSNETHAFRQLSANMDTFLTLSRLPYPVVAVVRGACLGAGLELALACSHRVAEENAVFALPEVTYDMMPGCGGTVRLPKLIGAAKALELILSGRTVAADEALDIGLIDRRVPRGRGVFAAIELIESRRRRSP